LVITSIADPFAGRVVRGVEEVAHDASCERAFSASRHNDPEREMEIFETFRRRQRGWRDQRHGADAAVRLRAAAGADQDADGAGQPAGRL
jgi:hypothetical protein